MSDLLSSKPIFSFSRRGIPEVLIHGVTAFKTQDQTLKGDSADIMIVARSLLKPWQALGAGGVVADDPVWAMSIASHSGQSIHLEQLQQLMERTGAKESELVCPRSYPIDPAIA